jgi:hypothetical protein
MPMKSRKNNPEELDDDCRAHIRMVFHDEVVPKLQRLDARLGNLECSFAGQRYRNWVLQFKSIGSDFEIVDFEYDADADSMDLDL